ncbi:MAG: PEP-CTERM sorting domain-containing protein [Verrucomicrobia bacterium]|nr:MAG: PEP-CTERM sorting domain-containing protein [Verrucomicrobiota bacterium]
MKMNRIPAIALVSLMSGLILPSLSSAAVIAGGNGSFETNTRGTAAFGGAFGQIWYLNPLPGNASGANIAGWTLYGVGGGAPPANTAWLMSDASGYGTASNGNYFINVESGPDWWLGTEITGLTSGWTYTLSFDTRRRSGGGGGNFDVFVNNTLSTTGAFTAANVAPTTTTWETRSINFTANASTMSVFIANTDVTNSGFMVDNFSIVPEPSAALLGGLGLLGMLRRRRR